MTVGISINIYECITHMKTEYHSLLIDIFLILLRRKLGAYHNERNQWYSNLIGYYIHT